MTVKGGTTPACAACKYQRRKCTPTCLLAPYFPANQPKMFQNVHSLFGVRNVTKILESITSKDLKDDAMKSIIYEAEIRARFPIHGCCGLMTQLQQQVHLGYEELKYILTIINIYKNHMNGGGPGRLGFGSTSSGLDDALIKVGNMAPVQAQVELDDALMKAGNLASLGFDDGLMKASNLASIQAQMELLAMNEERGILDFNNQSLGIYNIGDFIDDGEPQSCVENKVEIRHHRFE